MPRRIVVVGSGAREHALAWRLAGESGVEAVTVVPGSAAMTELDRVRVVPGVDPLDVGAVVSAARDAAAELVVVGPEAPLGAGLVDALDAAGLTAFGPTRVAAQLETSKAFCHEIAAAAGVRMAPARTFRGAEVDAARDYARSVADDRRGIVLKADGLAAGKGVIVTESLEQALDLIPSFLDRRPDDRPALVIEARLEGPEASVIAISDGVRVTALPAARDHKRLCDDDLGPNTGGMGAYSPIPELDDRAIQAIVETVHQPLVDEMRRRAITFRGFLYAGLILTADGPRLLECNVRLGDPEAQAILPRLATPLGPLLLAAARGLLPAETPALVPAIGDATVGVVLAAKGYPGEPRRGDPIDGLDEARAAGALIFHGGTLARQRAERGYGTNGGRVLTVVGQGSDVAAARAVAERAADAISWDGLQRRRDIGADAERTPALAGASR